MLTDSHWMDGTPVKWTNFVDDPGMNKKAGDCVFIDDEYNSQWDYWNCSDPTQALCQASKRKYIFI